MQASFAARSTPEGRAPPAVEVRTPAGHERPRRPRRRDRRSGHAADAAGAFGLPGGGLAGAPWSVPDWRSGTLKVWLAQVAFGSGCPFAKYTPDTRTLYPFDR